MKAQYHNIVVLIAVCFDDGYSELSVSHVSLKYSPFPVQIVGPNGARLTT